MPDGWVGLAGLQEVDRPKRGIKASGDLTDSSRAKQIKHLQLLLGGANINWRQEMAWLFGNAERQSLLTLRGVVVGTVSSTHFA